MSNEQTDKLRPLRLAVGKWPSILMSFGIEDSVVSGKHGPCPICGGKDRFRFIDREGDGFWMCNQCGSGDGMDLLTSFLKINFNEGLKRLKEVVSGCDYVPPRIIKGEERKRRMKSNMAIWRAGIKDHPLLIEYLTWRGLSPNDFVGADLRLAERLDYYDENRELVGRFPAMLARISTRDGKLAAIHRTYLRRDDDDEFVTEKKVTPSARDWKGGCVRLFDTRKTNVLMVAEGIETALALRAWVFRTSKKRPAVWAAVNANALTNLAVPDHITTVVIAADNDANFTGQKAAYALANRLVVHDKRNARVIVPNAVGDDWNDVLIKFDTALTEEQRDAA